MADTKISALTSATTPLAGTEVLPIVQSGATVKVSVANMTLGRTVTAGSVVVSSGEARLDLTATNGGGRSWNLYSGGGGNVGAGTFAIAEGGATQRFLIEGGGSGEGARITSNNRLLIGTTTNSGSRLVVAGDLGTSVGNGASSIRMTNTATGNYASISAGLPGVANEGMDFSVDGTRRMSLDGSGNLLIGTSGTVNNTRLRIVGGSTSGSNYTLLVEGSGGADNFYVRDDGELYSLPTYNRTSASASNVGVDAGGGFFRSTSSLKYKTDVNDATHGLAELLTLRPVTYKGKNDGQTIFGGLIAEQVHEAGLSEFVQYAEDGSPDALSYGNMVSLCIKAIQEQQAIITDLTTRLSALEAK